MAGAPAELIQRVPLFSDLDPKEVEQIARSFKERVFSPGDHITEEGKGGIGFFVIESGTAKITVGSEERGSYGPGDHFGEIALLKDVPRTATVTAKTDVDLLALERDEFVTAVTGHAASAEAAEAVVGTRLGVSPV